MQAQKRFDGFRDRGEYLWDPDWLNGLADRQIDGPFDVSQALGVDGAVPALAHRTVNGYFDPISITFVLDAMLKAHSASYIRSQHLRLWLNRQRPSILWDSVTVGRILADVARLSSENYGDDGPVGSGVDYKGHFYVVNGVVGRLYLLKLRAGMVKLAQDFMDRQSDGERSRGKLEDPWVNVDTNAVVIAGKVR